MPLSPSPSTTSSNWPKKRDFRAAFRIAWPMSLSYLGQLALGATDTIMLGRVGTHEVAAAGLALALYHIPFLGCLGMIFPATPMLAQARGERLARRMRRITRQCFWVGLTVCAPSLVLLWWLKPILLTAGQDVALAETAARYMRVFMWVLPLIIGFMALRCFIVALERPGWALIITWSAAALNIPLNWIFIYGNLGFPAMGIVGAGLASVTVASFMFLFLAGTIIFRLPFRRYGLFQNFWRPDWTTYRRFFRLGWPLGLQFLMLEGLFSIATLLVGLQGVHAVAAHTIALNLMTVLLVTFIGFADAAAIRTGLAYGRRDIWGIRRAINSILFLVLGLVTIVTVVIISMAKPLASVYLDSRASGAEIVLPLTVHLLPITAILLFFHALQSVVEHSLHGLLDMKALAIISLTTYWIGGMSVIFLLTYGLNMGVFGVWWGLIAGCLLSLVGLILRLRWQLNHLETLWA